MTNRPSQYAHRQGSVQRLRDVLELLRPLQWVKNLLVIPAPVFAGVILDPPVLWATLVAFLAFTLAAAGGYAVNDVLDLAADSSHPTKRHRAVVSGRVPVPTALAIGIGLMLGSLILSLSTRTGLLWSIIGLYIAMTILYSAWLKHTALVDIVVVALGFLLRALAGAAASDIPVSPWFAIVATFGALFVASAKRFSESIQLDPDTASDTRRALDGYPPMFLEFVLAISAGVAMLAYFLWTFEQISSSGANLALLAALFPFVLFILRYAQGAFAGAAGAPERLVLEDRSLLVLAALWTLLAAVGVAS